jgi:hypothetical protein
LSSPEQSAISACSAKPLALFIKGVNGMNIVERVKNILIQPKTEWPVIEREQTSAQTL